MHVVNIQEVYELFYSNPFVYMEDWKGPVTLPYPHLGMIWTPGGPIGHYINLKEVDEDWAEITFYVFKGNKMKVYRQFEFQTSAIVGREDGLAVRDDKIPQHIYDITVMMDGESGAKTWFEEEAKEIIYLSKIAIKLMHVKNVTLEEYDPNEHISRQVRRARERKGLGPLIKYKILHIKPYGRQPRKPASGNKTGVKQAVHTTRGHFKTFTADKPAFGKPWGVGTFWVGPFVSGNPEFGLVLKDYHIEINESDLNQVVEEGASHGTNHSQGSHGVIRRSRKHGLRHYQGVEH